MILKWFLDFEGFWKTMSVKFLILYIFIQCTLWQDMYVLLRSKEILLLTFKNTWLMLRKNAVYREISRSFLFDTRGNVRISSSFPVYSSYGSYYVYKSEWRCKIVSCTEETSHLTMIVSFNAVWTGTILLNSVPVDKFNTSSIGNWD